MQDIFSAQYSSKSFIVNNLEDKLTYFTKTITTQDYTLISFELQTDYEDACKDINYVSTRVSFIEMLKDKLLEKMMSDKIFSILTIKIEEISHILSKADEEYFTKEFLLEVELIIGKKLILAEYQPNLFVILFEDLTFKELEEKAKNFHLQISRFLNREKSKHIVSLYAIKIKDIELNPILDKIDKIANNEIDETLSKSKDIKYINNYQDNMNENEIINYMLDSIFLNQTDFKLLNIYNGMCINTSSKIIKKQDDCIYVKIEQLQGAVINIDKKTFLQSSILTKSIQAQLKYINTKEKYAILHKFKILDYNPNERQHGRVSSQKVIPIAIELSGSKTKGVMIDISATSVSIKVKRTRILNNILNKIIGLTFYLDDPREQSGSKKLVEEATVIHESCDKDGYIKIICIFVENSENENLLIDYIFNRQKNIIQHMKDMIL